MSLRKTLTRATPLALAVGAAFVPYREFFTSRVPVTRDLPFYFYPLKAHLGEALRHGEVPWIDPFRWGGVPLLGAPGAAAFYPANLLFVLLPLGMAMKAWILFHVAVAVVGFAVFARRLGLSPSGAAVSGLGFGLGGAAVSLSPFMGAHSSLAILPWLAAALVDLRECPGVRGAVVAAIPAALILLAGVPEFAFYGAVIGGLLLVQGGPGRLRAMGLAAGAALIAGILAAPQLLPSVSTAFESSRGPGGGMNDATASEKSLPSARLVEFLGDGLIADWTKVAAAPRVPDYPYLPSITPGRVALLLVAVGIVAGGKGRAASLVLCAVGIGLAFGPVSFVWRAAARTIPFFQSLRYPEKHLVLTAFGAAWLGALGLLALEKRWPPRSRTWVPFLALVAAGIVVDRERTARLLLQTDSPSCLTKAPEILAPLLATAREGAPPPRIFHKDSWAPVPRYDANDMFASGRIARASLDPAYASLFGAGYVFEPDYDVGLPREAMEWNRLIARSAPTSSPLTLRIARAAGAAAVLESVAQSDGSFKPALRGMKSPVSPYRFVSRVVSDPDPRQLFQKFLNEGADEETAWVVRPRGAMAAAVAPGRIVSVQDRPRGLSMDVDVPGPDGSYLVLYRLLTTTREAELDGRSVDVEETAFGFSGLEVPPGRHHLLFRPSGRPVRSGIAAALLGVGIVAVVWWRTRPILLKRKAE